VSDPRVDATLFAVSYSGLLLVLASVGLAGLLVLIGRFAFRRWEKRQQIRRWQRRRR